MDEFDPKAFIAEFSEPEQKAPEETDSFDPQAFIAEFSPSEPVAPTSPDLSDQRGDDLIGERIGGTDAVFRADNRTPWERLTSRAAGFVRDLAEGRATVVAAREDWNTDTRMQVAKIAEEAVTVGKDFEQTVDKGGSPNSYQYGAWNTKQDLQYATALTDPERLKQLQAADLKYANKGPEQAEGFWGKSLQGFAGSIPAMAQTIALSPTGIGPSAYWQQQGAGSFMRSYLKDKDIDTLSREDLQRAAGISQVAGAAYGAVELAVKSIPGMKGFGSEIDSQLANAVFRKMTPGKMAELSKGSLAFAIRWMIETLEEGGQSGIGEAALQQMERQGVDFEKIGTIALRDTIDAAGSTLLMTATGQGGKVISSAAKREGFFAPTTDKPPAPATSDITEGPLRNEDGTPVQADQPEDAVPPEVLEAVKQAEETPAPNLSREEAVEAVKQEEQAAIVTKIAEEEDLTPKQAEAVVKKLSPEARKQLLDELEQELTQEPEPKPEPVTEPKPEPTGVQDEEVRMQPQPENEIRGQADATGEDAGVRTQEGVRDETGTRDEEVTPPPVSETISEEPAPVVSPSPATEPVAPIVQPEATVPSAPLPEPPVEQAPGSKKPALKLSGSFADPEGAINLSAEIMALGEENPLNPNQRIIDGVKVVVEPSGGKISIKEISAINIGQGQGTSVLNTIKDRAQKAGIDVVLTPEQIGATSKERLTEYYKRNGFEEYTQGRLIFRAKQTDNTARSVSRNGTQPSLEEIEDSRLAPLPIFPTPPEQATDRREEPAAPTGEEPKKPWEMTPNEYATGDKDEVAIAKSAHPQHVKDALSKGLPVPDRVLDAYKLNGWARNEIERRAGQKQVEPPPAKTQRETEREAEDAELKALFDELNSLAGTLNMGPNPQVVIVGTKIASVYIKKGMRNFRDFAQAVKAQVGENWEKFKPLLHSFWSAASSSAENLPIANDLEDLTRAQANAVLAELDAPIQEQEAPNDTNGNGIDSSQPLENQLPEGNKETAEGVSGTGSEGQREADQDGDGRIEEEGSGRGDSVDGSAEPVLLGETTEVLPVEPKPEIGKNESPGDFVITKYYANVSDGIKLKYNIEAIRLVRQLEKENRYATKEEQEILSKYVGWGGLKPAFDPKYFKGNNMWAVANQALKELLSEEEYNLAYESTMDAHYTSKDVVDIMWNVARFMGFKGGRVLEPTVGVGNFIGSQPLDMKASSQWSASEIDGITGKIAKYLYPESNILSNTGFEDAPFADGAFDLVIGNPPFGQRPITDSDPRRKELSGMKVHNYVLSKAAMHLRPGGVMAAVVTHRFLDTADAEARNFLQANFRFLGAFRLPNTAFAKNAGTVVVTDVIFLQKLRAGEKAENLSWLDTNGTVGDGIRVNRYYQENPQNILGTSSMEGKMRGNREGGEYTVENDGRDIAESVKGLLEGSLSNLADVLTKTAEDADTSSVMLQQSDMPIGTLKLTDKGEVIRRDDNDAAGNAVLEVITPNSYWKPEAKEWRTLWELSLQIKDFALRGESIPPAVRNAFISIGQMVYTAKGEKKKAAEGKKLPAATQGVYDIVDMLTEGKPWNSDAVPGTFKKAYEGRLLGTDGLARVKGLLGLRKAMLELNKLERTEPEGSVKTEESRKEANRVYDAFVKEFGFVYDPDNMSILQGDIGAEAGAETSYTAAITKKDASTKGMKERPSSAKKADIFKKRLNYPHKPVQSAENAFDGADISFSEKGKLDLPYIAELTGKPLEQVIEELSTGENPRIFKNPETGFYEDSSEYLSGNLKAKIDPAKQAGLTENVKALKAALPAPKSRDKIKPLLRSPWIPTHIYRDFLGALGASNASVDFYPEAGLFEAEGIAPSLPTELGVQFENDYRDVVQMFKLALSGKKAEIKDRDGKVIEDATKQVNALIDLMGKVFKQWAFADDTRAQEIVDAFNDKMNSIVLRKIDGEKYLRPHGSNPNIRLRKTQKDGAWRAILSKVLLLDHVVGAGKTFTIITAIMERRRLGLSKKPLVVVPNHLVQQWARDFYKLYPGANILAAAPADFEKHNRKRLFARMASGDFDAIIIGHSSLGFIENNAKKTKALINEQIAELRSVLQTMENKSSNKRNVSQITKKIDSYRTKFKALEDRPVDLMGLDFEAMGIDYFALDEAHEYKNLEYSTSGERIVGMNDPMGSKKAFDMLLKVRSIQSRPTGGVVFASGTPVSNSLVEIYSIMKYLIPDSLKQMGIGHYDAWAGAFADVQTKFLYGATGKLTPKRTLSDLVNVPALQTLYHSFTDTITLQKMKKVYSADMEKSNKETGKTERTEYPVPKIKQAGRQFISTPSTPLQTQYWDYLIARMKAIKENRGDKEYAKVDNPLWVLSDARRASLDIRTRDPYAKREETGKVTRTAQEVMRIYKDTAEQRGTQLVFCDGSVPSKTAVAEASSLLREFLKFEMSEVKAKAFVKNLQVPFVQAYREAHERIEALMETQGDSFDTEKFEAFMTENSDIEEVLFVADTRFSVYDDLRALLVEQGVPANEIAFIHDFKSADQKTKLFDDVNAGNIRVLIGSTPKMGAGMNAQRRLVALHHMDAPWKPSEIEQREGRIIRTGNLFYEQDPDGFEIEILAYSTEGTSDAVMWQVLERKAKAIEQFREGEETDGAEEGTSDSADYAQFMASSTGNPVFLWKLEADKALSEIQAQFGGAIIAKADAENYLKTADQVISKLQKSLAALETLNPQGNATFKGKVGSFEEYKAKKAEEDEKYKKAYADYLVKFDEANTAMAEYVALPKEEQEKTKKPTFPNPPSRVHVDSASMASTGYAQAVKAFFDSVGANGSTEMQVGDVRLMLTAFRGAVTAKDKNPSSRFELHAKVGEYWELLGSGNGMEAYNTHLPVILEPERLQGRLEDIKETKQSSLAYNLNKKAVSLENASLVVNRDVIEDARETLDFYEIAVSWAEVEADIARSERPENPYIQRDKNRPLSMEQAERGDEETVEVDGEWYRLMGVMFEGGWRGNSYKAVRLSDNRYVSLYKIPKTENFGLHMIAPKEASDRLAQAEGLLQEEEDTEQVRAVTTPAKQNRAVKGVRSSFLDRMEQETLAEIEELKSGGTMGMGKELGLMANYVLFGAIKLGQGVRDFTQWSNAMVQKFGEDIKPRLLEIFNAAKAVEKMDFNSKEEIKANAKTVTEVVFGKVPSASITGIKREASDAQRIERGLEPLPLPDRQTNPEQYAQALDALEKDSKAALATARNILKEERPSKAIENFQLLYYETFLRNRLVDLRTAMLAAFDAGNREQGKEIQKDVNSTEDDLDIIERAMAMGGTEAARSLQSRVRMLLEDYSLDAMILRERAARGGEPLDEEGSTVNYDKLKEMSDRIIELTKEVEAANEKARKAQEAKAFEDVGAGQRKESGTKKVIQRLSPIREKANKRAEDSRAALREIFARASSGVDPAIVPHLTNIGVSYLLNATMDVLAFTDKLVSEFGEVVRPFAEEAYEKAKAVVNKERKKLKYSVGEDVTMEDLEDGIQEIMSRLTKKANDGQWEKITPLVRKLCRIFVLEGILTNNLLDREELTTKVHDVLVSIYPEQTVQETVDAISGYGKFIPLAKDQVSREIQQMRGELQQTRKIEDMLEGLPPKKTGGERPEQGKEWRRLNKEVAKAKKLGKFDKPFDSEAFLKTSLQSALTRKTNEIEDIDRQLEEGKTDAPSPAPDYSGDPAGKAELDRLDALLKVKREQFKQKFGKEKEEAQKATALEKQIAELERQIKDRDLFPVKKEKRTPEQSQKLKDLLVEKTRLIAERDRLRKIAKPPKTLEERKNEAKRRAAEKEIEALQQQIDAKKRTEVKPAKPANWDAKTKALLDLKAKKQQEFNDLFGKEMEEAQRLKALIRSRENDITEKKRQIKERDLFPTKKAKKAPISSAELTALEAERVALDAELDLLREMADPTGAYKNRMENLAYQARTTKRIAELQRMQAENDFLKEEPVPLKLNPESLELQRRLEEEKRRFNYRESQWKFKQETKLVQAMQIASGGLDALQDVVTSGDLGASFIQGGLFYLAHPARWAKAMIHPLKIIWANIVGGAKLAKWVATERPSIRRLLIASKRGEFSFTAQEVYRFRQWLKEQPLYEMSKKTIKYSHDYNSDEDHVVSVMLSKIADHIPLVGISKATFSVFGDFIRYSWFVHAAKFASGNKPSALTPKEIKAIGNFANEFTFRGKVGLGESDGTIGVASRVFFAFKMAVAAWNIIALRPLVQARNGSARTRMYAAGEYSRILLHVGLIVLYAWFKAQSDDDEDKEEGQEFLDFITPGPKFLKLKTEDGAYVAVGSKVAKHFILLADLASGVKTYIDGDQKELKPYDKLQLIVKYVRSLLSPRAGAALDIMSGADYMGEETTAGSVAKNLALPLSAKQSYEYMSNEELQFAGAYSALALLGLSTLVVEEEQEGFVPENTKRAKRPASRGDNRSISRPTERR